MTARGVFARRLLAWYDRERRDLPWRRTRDPWAIWVSEVMLQQTRVEVVREAWSRFLERFPTPAACAAATDDELHRAWQGLGYYRRARLLRDGARAVLAAHAGRVPADAASLGRLPGIGEYTRGAIASIAFDEPEVALDGNVERVIARHAAIEGDVKRSATRRELGRAVVARMDRARPGDFNQALMELGALVCTPRAPRCAACPVAADCAARARGLVANLPRLPARRAPIDVAARAILCARPRGTVLAARIPAGEVNEGQLTLPGAGLLRDCPDADALRTALLARYGARVEVGAELTRVRHAITCHRITLTVHAGSLPGRLPSALVDADPRDERAAWTTAARKVMLKLGRC